MRPHARPQVLAPSTGQPRTLGDVLRAVARDRIDRVVFAVTAVVVGFGYSLLLPFAFTQRISFANWSYLDARYVVFSLAFAVGFAWLVTLQVHAMRVLARAAHDERGAGGSGPFAVLAAIASALPSLLCCSPILPTVIGLLGLSASARLSTSVQLQHFFATKENLLLAGALVLLLASGLWSLRKLARAACLAGECRAAAIGEHEADSSVPRSANGYTVGPAAVNAGVTPRSGLE